MHVLSKNYGLTKKANPVLDATKHVESGMRRLCFPEEVSSIKFKLALLTDPKRKNSAAN